MAELPKKMTDNDLIMVVNALESSALAYRDEFMSENEELLRRYNNELYGDEEEGSSKVLSTDVNDLVNSDMTSLVRVFMGSGNIMTFKPTTDNPEDIQEAKDKTALINHIVRKRKDSYKTNYDFLLDIEVQKMGVIHYYMDENTTTEEIPYSGIDEIELEAIKADIDADPSVESWDIVEKEKEKDGTYEVTFRVTRECQELKIVNIPTEDFLLTPNSRNIEDAPVVGHITWKSRGELVSEGYSEDEVASWPTSGTSADQSNKVYQNNNYSGSTMKSIRFRDEGGELTEEYATWANELVRVVTLYALIDYDGDGIAERRYIVKIANDILENEPYNHVPYAVCSALPEAHKAIGDGRASLALEDQRVKTVVKRQMLNNMYMHANPRSAISERVDVDDFLDVRLNGIVRVEKGSNPANEIFPLITPYIGDSALQVIQYIDQTKANRAGTLMASQGLEADNLHKETATRFDGIERANEAKIELVCRNIAEIGYRKLFEGICWTLKNYQNTELEVMILGRPLRTNPKQWKYDHELHSSVGLGAGNNQKTLETLSGIFSVQTTLKQEGSELVDETKRYNTLNKIIEASGLNNPQDYFNNPEIPQQMLMPQLEKVTMAFMQAQQMLEQMQQSNPLAEAEMVRAQARLQEVQMKEQVEMIKAQSNKEIKQMEMMQKGAQFQADLEKAFTELELKYGVDLRGVGVPSTPSGQNMNNP